MTFVNHLDLFETNNEGTPILLATGHLVGSRFTNTVVTEDSDYDYFFEAKDDDHFQQILDLLFDQDFTLETEIHYQDSGTTKDPFRFLSFRKEGLNILLTKDHDFATRHRLATNVCKRLNIPDKSDRICLFQAVLYERDTSDIPSGRPKTHTELEQEYYDSIGPEDVAI